MYDYMLCQTCFSVVVQYTRWHHTLQDSQEENMHTMISAVASGHVYSSSHCHYPQQQSIAPTTFAITFTTIFTIDIATSLTTAMTNTISISVPLQKVFHFCSTTVCFIH
jgi:hypothetical protein